MKTPLLTSLALTLLVPCLASAEDKPLRQRANETVQTLQRETREATAAAGRVAREAWTATKEALTTDPREYREGAVRRLKELGGEVATLQDESQRPPLANRSYFATRIKALREHLTYAEAELAKLPGDAQKADYDKARTHFNATLEHLERAVDQAQAEARSSV